jgi:hypothetical protein
VSLAGVGRLPPVKSFAVSAQNEMGANVVYVKGTVIRTTGGDNEFLMQESVKISKKEYEEALKKSHQKKAEWVLGSFIADRKNRLASGGYSGSKKDIEKWETAVGEIRNEISSKDFN